jgi:phage host-nuclease inhibitor protein Gam
MDDQISEKDRTSETIEGEMHKKILAQEDEIKKQCVLYREQAALKHTEEGELKRVLGDYKRKHDEFAKAMKKSRDTFKVYEGEIKNLNSKILDLDNMKKRLLLGSTNTPIPPAGSSKKVKAAALQAAMRTIQEVEAETERVQTDWAAEKAQMLKEKEELAALSSSLSEQIKNLKEQKAVSGGH